MIEFREPVSDNTIIWVKTQFRNKTLTIELRSNVKINAVKFDPSGSFPCEQRKSLIIWIYPSAIKSLIIDLCSWIGCWDYDLLGRELNAGGVVSRGVEWIVCWFEGSWYFRQN